MDKKTRVSVSIWKGRLEGKHVTPIENCLWV